ncbi:MAG: 1-pyrroline-5-carboxylate dehydrogenase [Ignavibacteriales bacterium CG_4_9_14_3_um_filter_34_10]|nr:MAG: 1-pyrroline-5-carboxylate dehydrogenase [Ignavibacteriales bacterium CG_4_9_14_3_um_filter_34_10]
MSDAIFNVSLPQNEPVKNYAPESQERKLLKSKLNEMVNQTIEIPVIIGGKEVFTGSTDKCVCPHDHQKILANYQKASEKEVNEAIKNSMKAHVEWSRMDWQDRISVFLKAADLLSQTEWRYTLNAATMLGQSKNPFQAEIDSAAELIDFFRFNAYYATQIYKEQPLYSPVGLWNRMEYRALEGFIFAVAPFNFTSICGNLPTSPAIMGNVALLKPASSSVYSAYFIMKLLQAAGLPDGVINFVPGSGSQVGNPVMNSEYFGGIHFTGSTPTFQSMWRTAANNLSKYKSYPRIVGETGGKDFIFAHSSADIKALGTAMIRGAFEYQGQKCSAASRAYIPKSIWSELKEFLISELKTIKMGDVLDFTNFMNAVIDKGAFDTITGYIEFAKKSNEAEIIFGGNYDNSKGYFIEPTIIVTTNPKFKTIEEEVFGPVLTLFVYEDSKYEETLKLCDETSPYSLTGAIFAQDRKAIVTADKMLRNAAGNFYINDKPTGAVVGQQPFGGARASGTNDKAGSYLNLIRWVSARTIKENFIPPKDYRYSFLNEK